MLAATNRPDIIDPAFLRAGRFDIHLELPVPNEEARRNILVIHTRGKPLTNDVDPDGLAAATAGLVGSDIDALCLRASMLAIREFVKDCLPISGPSDLGDLKVSAQHFHQAIQEMAGHPA